MDDLRSFTDILCDEISDSQQSQPMSLPSSNECNVNRNEENIFGTATKRPAKGTGQYEQFRSIEEIDPKYRGVFTYPYFNLVQSSVIEDALYSDKSMVVCAPTGSGKTVIFEMAIVQLLMYLEDKHYTDDFKIIYMAPVKALCTERLSEWYPKFTKLGLLCIVVTGDTDVDFSQIKPYRIIITTPEKWDMLTRRWRDHRSLVEAIKLFLIDEVHILNDESRGPALEVVVSRMKTIETSAQSAYRIEQLQKKYQGTGLVSENPPPRIRFVAISATVGNPEDVASWIGDANNPAVFYKFGDECRPVKLKRVVEGYPCSVGTSIFKFDITLNYKLWPIIQKYHNGKPTLIFCNTRKSVELTAEMLSREITVHFRPDQKAQLIALASTLKNKKLQSLILSGVGCHHAGLLFEERTNIEHAFRNRDLPILITTTTLAMGVNLPAHLVIIKNTQQYVNGAYQEYSISTVLQMVGRAGRPQYDTEATAVIMTRLADKPRYQALVGGSEPLQSYLHKRLPENLNSEAALGTVTDVAQCVQWLRSTFLWVRARRDPKRYLGLPATASQQLITKKIEELCVKAMNGLASTGLITMDEASCIESTEAGRLMSIYYIDLETMKHIMKIEGNETLERLLCIVCESHELADLHLRVDERRSLNALNRNRTATTIRFPMKGKITTRQMKLNCIIQAVLGCLPIPDPSLNQEAMKIMRVADRVCKCLVAYVTRPDLISQEPKFFSAVLNSLVLAKCISAQLWENSPFLSRQLRGIGPTLSALLASAGKVNFLLLRESHPRDLERIMNKGPPAGNVLLKQVCLLPKYVLTITAEDEKNVNIQLVLQNQSYLADNLGDLTAGEAHTCHIVVGDSENHILLCASIKDKDLINIYVGRITYKITRKHDFEHKVYAYCISSKFVGIDDQCEHVFQDLNPILYSRCEDSNIEKTQKKQTHIVDKFNERKRKYENNVTHSKENKRRESTIIEKFKCFKESLCVPSKNHTENLNISTKMSDKVLSDTTLRDKDISVPVIMNTTKIDDNKNNNSPTQIFAEHHKTDQFADDDKINCLNIKGQSFTLNTPLSIAKDTKATLKNTLAAGSTDKSQKNYPTPTKQLLQHKHKKQKVTRNQKQSNLKTNFTFIDLLEKNICYSDDDEINNSEDNIGFSKAIKPGIDNYLMKTKCNSIDSNAIINKMLETSGDIDKPKMDKRELDYELSNNKIDTIYKELNINKPLNIKNNTNDEIVKQVCSEDDKLGNTSDHKEKKKLTPENMTCHENTPINSFKEQTQNMITPCSLSDNSIEVKKSYDKYNNNDNKILSLKTQDFRQTAKSYKKSDITYNRYAGVVSPFCLLNNKEEPCKLALLNKTVNTVNCIEKSYNQCNKITDKTKNDPIEHTKKFTCTSTKIDICTSRQNDQIIRVIRKLDVTEAVYIANNCNNMIPENLTKNEFSEVTVVPNSKPIGIKNILQNISDPIFSSNDYVQPIDETNIIKGYKLEGFHIPDNSHHLPKPIEHVCNKDQNIRKLAVEKKSDSNVTKISSFELGARNNATLYKMPIKRLQNDAKIFAKSLENIQQNNETYNEKIGECENIICTIEKPPTLPENNTISDILQKYKKLFQNNHDEQNFPNRTLNKDNDTKNNIIESNKARPFKILEIDTVKVSLPDILLDVTPAQTILKSESPVKDTGHNEEICNIEDPPLVTAPLINEECLNFKIDQSMFDPKTLLFCLGKENSDEIIPPPLEYRDTSIKNTQEDYHMNTSNFSEYNQNIYDASQSELQNITESDHASDSSLEKMEFWMLSREESLENYDQFSLNQDIMPHKVKSLKSPENNNWVHQNNTMLGHTLEQFKFNHKEKMKLNRNFC